MFSIALLWIVLGLIFDDTVSPPCWERIGFGHTHTGDTYTHTVMHIYTLIMSLLMNYKQTLRPCTYIPVMSGLVPNDEPYSTIGKDTHTHTSLLSLNSMLTELPHLHNNCAKVGNNPRNSITVHPSRM